MPMDNMSPDIISRRKSILDKYIKVCIEKKRLLEINFLFSFFFASNLFQMKFLIVHMMY